MKKLAVSLILVFAMALLTAEASAWAQKQKKGGKKTATGPQVSIAEMIHQTEVKAGGQVSHDFQVKNTGQKELKIIRVTAGCGCVAAGFDRSIAPGQTGRITLTVETHPGWAGQEVTQSALVVTNDPKAQYLSVTLKIEVKDI